MPAVPADGVSLQVEEKIKCVLKKDGGLETMELQGTMMLEINGGESDAFIRVQIAQGANPGFQFKRHPHSDPGAKAKCLPKRDRTRNVGATGRHKRHHTETTQGNSMTKTADDNYPMVRHLRAPHQQGLNQIHF